MAKTISIVVPTHNESGNVQELYKQIKAQWSKLPYNYELIFVDDGSTDDTVDKLLGLKARDKHVQVIELVRNFGKEVALTAGLHSATGHAAIMIDADLQHPVSLMPEFIERWENGAEMVVGVRKRTDGQGPGTRLRSWLFYKIMNSIADTKVKANATDYRLLDRDVVDEFNRFTERNRITRGLIDWLGFHREYVYFDAAKRTSGAARYGFIQLFRLAINSFVSLSLLPLQLAGYLGIVITLFSGFLGLFIIIEKYMLHDPLHMHFSGPAQLADTNMFLIGIVLMSLGLVALYIANIHGEVINRPLYVVRRSRKPRSSK